MKTTQGELPGVYYFTVGKQFIPLISVDPPTPTALRREGHSPTLHITQVSTLNCIYKS